MFDGFDPTHAQVFPVVPEDALFSESVEDRAYDWTARAHQVRKLLLGEANVLAEAVLAPRLESPGQLAQGLGQSSLCSLESKTLQSSLHLSLAPTERFDHFPTESGVPKDEVMEFLDSNPPYGGPALDCRGLLGLERIGAPQGGAEQLAGCQQAGRKFVAFVADAGKLDLPTENAEEIAAALALCVDRAPVPECMYRCRWTVALQILQRQAGEK
jgi:hypothetical protein